MNTLIAIITWGINCPLERSCAILLNPVQPMTSLAVFNFPVRPGRWRHGIDGLAGLMSNERSNLQKIINNSRFLIFPWVEVKNLASSGLLPWLSRPCRTIGKAAMAIAQFLWKHWLTGNDSKALAIRRPTGYTWEKRPVAVGWTGTILSRAQRLRRFMFIPFHPDFVKNWRDVRKGVPWDLLLAFLNRIQQRNFEI